MGVAGESEMYPNREGGVRLALVDDGGKHRFFKCQTMRMKCNLLKIILHP